MWSIMVLPEEIRLNCIIGETILAKAESYKNEGICVNCQAWIITRKTVTECQNSQEKKWKQNIFEEYV